MTESGSLSAVPQPTLLSACSQLFAAIPVVIMTFDRIAIRILRRQASRGWQGGIGTVGGHLWSSGVAGSEGIAFLAIDTTRFAVRRRSFYWLVAEADPGACPALGAGTPVVLGVSSLPVPDRLQPPTPAPRMATALTNKTLRRIDFMAAP